jgi:SAM-dependent methyltransferase
MVDSNNLAGHRARFEQLFQNKPRDEAFQLYVGGNADRLSIGHREKEAIAHHRDLAEARIIDIGCGIGRLTRFLKEEPITSYLGFDIIDEVLAEAAATVDPDHRFTFKKVDKVEIPAPDQCADIVSAFSVMTHLLDEEVFCYFKEASRVLTRGGVAVFSFLDFSLPSHRDMFLEFCANHDKRHDVLKWFEKSTLEFFATSTGFEVIEFQDAGSPLPAKFGGRRLPDGRMMGDNFAIGQSIVYARKI